MDDFVPHNGITWGGGGHVGVVNYGPGDNQMVCLFYTKSVHNPAKSLDAGRPVHEDQTYVKIHPPGERFNIIDRPARQEDTRRFPAQWAAFQQQKEQTPDGTPIDLLYPDQPSIAKTLRAFGIHTIEQCGDLSAAAIGQVGMGSQRYVNDAKKYLSASEKGVGANQLRRELEKRDNDNAVLKQQLEVLKGEVARLTSLTQNGALAQMQEMLAGAMGRPVVPGLAPQSQVFDAQTAQINATHAASAKPTRRKRIQPE
jgi:hypothetical protein